MFVSLALIRSSHFACQFQAHLNQTKYLLCKSQKACIKQNEFIALFECSDSWNSISYAYCSNMI